ncbi:DExH-box splicing factor binding site-domain-containing protein [Mucor mucedo]|uniref:DExH-box splicing factor binding site-domain-containing protein n=1 Tax=Mucor mucedo TaxID=29922 RepID=UPI00221EFA9B|nr:DExH-box splicing factor binding site-domain-containing protein [Mucor mucedo]KAI7890877.1 DExH-box splicing factor binding site-domain-containing protein [Mucor mucedo]
MSKLPLQSKAFRPKFQNKRAIFGDDEDEESHVNDELVVGFEDNKIKEAVPKKEIAPLSISPLPNADWRALAKSKKELYVPARAQQQQSSNDSKPEVLLQSATSFGLQIQKKKTITNENTSEETTTIEQDTIETVEEAPKTLEERAIEALIKESLGEGEDEEDNKPKKVIHVNEASLLKDDLENRPDETTMDAYDNIPVEEFGAALLRGLGWNEGDGIGRNRKKAPAPPAPPVKQREALLGLGAKPEEVDKDNKSKHRRAAYEYKDTSLFKKISKRKHDEDSPSRDDKRRKDDRRDSRRDDRKSDRSDDKRRDRSSDRRRDRSGDRRRDRSGDRRREKSDDKRRDRSRDDSRHKRHKDDRRRDDDDDDRRSRHGSNSGSSSRRRDRY